MVLWARWQGVTFAKTERRSGKVSSSVLSSVKLRALVIGRIENQLKPTVSGAIAMAVQVERRVFTRQEFYDFVWSAPATKLARELGCSDVMIGKICKSFDIPKPYPGYWAMVANGKSPDKTALPKNVDPALQTLTFHRHEDYESTVNEPPRELQYDEDVQHVLKRHQQLGPIKVAESLRNPHYLVSITSEDDDRRIKDSKIPFAERDYSSSSRKPKTLSLDVSCKERQRAYRILDALIKRIVALGGEVKIVEPKHQWGNVETVVFLGQEQITSIRLREKSDRKRILDPTAKYSWDRDRSELVPSGLLLLDRGPSDYNSPLAMDGKAKKIEDKLDALVLGFIRQAGEARIKRREDEERAKIIAERERVRREREAEIKRREEELQKRKAEETARLKKLLDHSDSWRRSELVRDYLDALCVRATQGLGAVPLDSELADYLRWGFQQADRIDPLRPSPHSVLDEQIDVSELTDRSDPRKPR